jgi:outer membrane protein assembly factor BamB
MPIAIDKKITQAASRNLNRAFGDGMLRLALVVASMMCFVPGLHELTTQRRVEQMIGTGTDMSAKLLWVLILLAASTLVGSAQEVEPFQIGPDTLVEEWLVAGPFVGDTDTDFLESVGGEKNIAPAPGLSVMQNGEKRVFGQARVSKPFSMHAIWKKTLPIEPYGKEPCVAELPKAKGVYYLAAVVESERDGSVAGLVHLDTSFKNGQWKLLVNGRTIDRGSSKRHYTEQTLMRPYALVEVPLKSGRNRLLVKVGDTDGLMVRLLKPDARASERTEAVGAEVDGYRGYRFDGSGRFPDAAPPLFWDERRGQNIRWRTELPSWSQGGVIVAGGRVFTQAEPNLLICLDAGTGELLWTRVVDQLEAPCFSKEQRREGRELWRKCNGMFEEFTEACAEYQWLAGCEQGMGYVENAVVKAVEGARHSETWRGVCDDSVATNERVEELRSLWRERGWGGQGSEPYREAEGTHYHHDLTIFPMKTDNERELEFWRQLVDLDRRFGFHLMTSQGMQQRGHTQATPCSDGESVFVNMGWGQVACYDFDGDRKWIRWFPADKEFQWSRFERSPGLAALGNQGQNRVSPLLHNDLLIVINGYKVRVLDKASGSLRWEAPIPEGGGRSYRREYGQPRVITLDTTELLVCPQGPTLQLADGKVVIDKCAGDYSPKGVYARDDYQRGNNFQYIMGTPAWDDHTALMSTVMGVAAWSFGGDRAAGFRSELAWTWSLPFERYAYHPGGTRLGGGQAESVMRTSPLLDPVYGLFYAQLYMGELYAASAASGETVREWIQPGGKYTRGDEGQSPVLANGLVITHRNKSLETFFWQSGRNIRPVGTGKLVSRWTEDVRERKLSWADYKARWIDRGYAWTWATGRNWCDPFLVGDKIYIRTDEAMYCIGEQQ